MSRVVFLLEERSMKVLLDGLLPRLFPGLPFLCVPHEGKQDLEKSIPRKLRAWHEPGVAFCIVRDNDRGDCRTVKERLLESCASSGRSDVIVRIACQELEAWYFGDPAALACAFENPRLAQVCGGARFRDPDAIDQPSSALREIVPEFQKVSGARRMASVLGMTSASLSFQVFLEGIERLRARM